MILKALSMDYELKKSLEKSAARVNVDSIFSRALNMKTYGGDLITLLSREDFNGPNTVLLSKDIDFTDFHINPDIEVNFNNGCILVGKDIFIDFSDAFLWKYNLPALPLNRDRVSKNLNLLNISIKEPFSYDFLLNLMKTFFPHFSSVKELEKLSFNFISLLKALKKRDKRRIEDFLSRIIGLGSGFTPLGDDLLLGLLSAFYFTESDFRRNIIPSLKLFKSKTTFVSSCLLNFAISGRFSQPVLEVLEGLFFSQDFIKNRAFNNMLVNYGASSGKAILVGIFSGTYLYIND